MIIILCLEKTEKYIKISTKDYKIEVEKGKDYVSTDTSTTITNTSLKFNGFSKIKNLRKN